MTHRAPLRRTSSFAALALLLGLGGTIACASRPQPVVALLTDFGTRDGYVGELKGAILSANPGARIVDLTHQVPDFDVREGAWLLQFVSRSYPTGTVFVAIVDPDVSTARRSIAVRSAAGRLYVGPDNGLFTPIYETEAPCAIRELTQHAYWRDGVTSTTFQGRDVFGPVGAHLAAGVAFEALGPTVTDPVTFRTAPARMTNRTILGEIVHVDHYGNCSTNVPASMLDPDVRTYTLNGRAFVRATYYGEVPVGTGVIVIDSKDHVELAVNQGSCAGLTGLHAGAKVVLEPAR